MLAPGWYRGLSTELRAVRRKRNLSVLAPPTRVSFPLPPQESVIASAAIQIIVAGAAGKGVGLGAAVNGVDAVATVQIVACSSSP